MRTVVSCTLLLACCAACSTQASGGVDASAPAPATSASVSQASASASVLPARVVPAASLGPDDQFRVVARPAAHEGVVTLRCTEEPDVGCICNGKSLDPCATKTLPTMQGHDCTYACGVSDHVVRLQCLTGVGVTPGGCMCAGGVINPCAGGKRPRSVKRDGDFCAVTCD